MTRLYFLSLFAALFLMSSCGVPNAGSEFYHAHKRKEGVRNVALPGWLIYTSTSFAHDIVEEEETRVVLQIAKKVKKMQLMFDEDGGAIEQADVRAFQEHLRSRRFEDLVYVRAEDTTVSFMVRSKKDKLRDLIVLVHAEDDFVFMNMRTNIRIKHLARMIDAIMELDKRDPPDKKKKEKEPAPAPPAKEPVARPRA